MRKVHWPLLHVLVGLLLYGRCHDYRSLIVPLAVLPRYRVVVSYPPQSEAELELKEGDIVFVHRKREDGWFKGTLQRNGRTGLFPGSFVDSMWYALPPRLDTACHHENQTDARPRPALWDLLLSGRWTREVQSRTGRVVIGSTVDSRGEHTMNTSFLLLIYIFVTIQLLNVCLVLFLTLLYIRTQRRWVLKQPTWAVDIDTIWHILTYFIDWPFL